MEAEIVFLVLALAAAILAGPVLAVIALIRVQALHGRRTSSEDLPRRLDALERRVDALQRHVREVRPGAPPEPLVASPPEPASPRAAAAPVAPPGPVPPTAPLRPAAEPHPRIDFESIIAGRWLNRIGIVALLMAVAFFLKYAFDNDWIGPAGRVAVGLLSGAALLVYSQWLLSRYRYFSEGIAAIAAGVFYLSLYAAWGLYQLVPQGAAFAGMVVVTAGFAALAIGRDSQRLGLLALCGGMMTPGLLSTGEDRQAVLFTYLALLDAGLLAVARLRAWRALQPVALAGTLVYFVAWFDRFYDPTDLAPTLAFASIFFLVFAALSLLRLRRRIAPEPEQYVLVVANAAWFMIALHAMLYRQHRWGLTLAVLVLAAVHVAAVRALPRVSPDGARPARLLYAGLALTCVTLAVPIRLEGEWIPIAWAVEGAVLIWSGFRSRTRLLRAMGLVLFVLVIPLLLGQGTGAVRLLLNARLAACAVAVAAFVAALWLARSHRDLMDDEERKAFGVLGIAANALAVWALSLEVWDFCRTDAARQMGLSVLWAACASALIVGGVRAGVAALRWQGLALLGAVVVKVFLFDLSFLQRGYRILSFLALGVVLLVVSFLYQRKLRGSVT